MEKIPLQYYQGSPNGKCFCEGQLQQKKQNCKTLQSIDSLAKRTKVCAPLRTVYGWQKNHLTKLYSELTTYCYLSFVDSTAELWQHAQCHRRGRSIINHRSLTHCYPKQRLRLHHELICSINVTSLHQFLMCWLSLILRCPLCVLMDFYACTLIFGRQSPVIFGSGCCSKWKKKNSNHYSECSTED